MTVQPSSGFEAEQDKDTFTIRFPDGRALTAWADGRIIVTKAEADFVPFELNVSDLKPIQPDNWKRTQDGTLRPFIPSHSYAELRDDDRFLYNEGVKPEGLV